MKKKLLTLMLSGCMALPVIGLTGCAHEHKFSEDWTTNATHHWNQCNQCEEKHGYEEHDWDEGVIVENATPTEDGVRLFVCEDCGKTKTEDVEYVYATNTMVTEQEWLEAFDFDSIQKCQSIETMKDYYTDVPVTETIVKHGDVYYSVDRNLYRSKEAGKYYAYSLNQEGQWEKHETQAGPYLEFSMVNIVLSTFSTYYDSFTYNPETQAYEIENFQAGDNVVNVQIFFMNGKIVKMMIANEENFTEIELSYDNITLTLPANPIFVTATVNETEWETALNLDAIDKYQMTQTGNGVMDIVKDGDVVYICGAQDGYSEMEMYYSKEGNEYYEYSKDSDSWTKTSIIETYYTQANGAFILEAMICLW